MGGIPPSYNFFENLPSKPMPPMWCHPFKNEAPPSEKQPPPPSPHWTAKPSSKKLFLGKKFKKSETVINTCASIIKQHWKKMQETPQECDFLTCSIQNLVRKVKQFVRKYYISWIITQLVAINIALLKCYFATAHCFLITCSLICNCPLLKD